MRSKKHSISSEALNMGPPAFYLTSVRWLKVYMEYRDAIGPNWSRVASQVEGEVKRNVREALLAVNKPGWGAFTVYGVSVHIPWGP